MLVRLATILLLATSQQLAILTADPSEEVPSLEIELDQPEASSNSSKGLANAGNQARAPEELRHQEIELEQSATAGSDSQGLVTAEWEHLWNR
eukprot:gene8223-1489_t